ncbi:MAG: hypothetical protein FRX49_06718 [Trebouxia sp. A1-2]|nr:MAG: hypothetical protein FRX49_06718 [Trebouxia sp. A1-2]
MQARQYLTVGSMDAILHQMTLSQILEGVGEMMRRKGLLWEAPGWTVALAGLPACIINTFCELPGSQYSSDL